MAAIWAASVLLSGCSEKDELQGPDESASGIEVIGGGWADEPTRQWISSDPLGSARLFGLKVALSDSQVAQGWYFRALVGAEISVWSASEPLLRVRQRCLLAANDPGLREGILGRFFIYTYDADPSWTSLTDLVRKLGRGFRIADRTVNGLPAKVFRLMPPSPSLPEMYSIILLRQPYFYRIIDPGNAPHLDEGFEQVIGTLQLVTPLTE